MTRKKDKNTPAANTTSISIGKDVLGNFISGDGNQINYYGEQRPAVILRAVPPAPPPYFTGREDERARLAKSLLSGEAVAITALHGMGGIGKTALAQKVAEDLLNEKAFPGGVLWWSLGPQADSFAALSAWAAYFDPQANLTQLPPEARAGFVRAGLARLGRLCAILDDVWDEESAQALLGALPPGTPILLTTRDADLAKSLRCRVDNGLPGLPEDKCLELLASLLGPLEKHETVAKEIARLTEGLPLALELVAGLADAPADLPALAKQLAKAPQLDLLKLPGEAKREKSLEVCFALSYNALAPQLQARFRALGVFPAPFDEAALFAVWGADDAKSLKRLLRRSLLKKDENGLLRQHALLRAYAAALLGHEAKEEIEMAQRHSHYYANVIRIANKLILQGGEGMLAGLQLFDAEYKSIAAGQGWAAQHFSNPLAVEDCNWYGWQSSLLSLRLHPHEQIHWCEAALRASKILKNKRAESAHLCDLGNAYADLAEPRRAIEFYEQALVIDREIGDKRGEGRVLGNLGNAYRNLSEPRQAIEYYEQILAIFREIGDKRGEGAALGNLGLAYADLGKPRRAIEYYEQILTIFHEIGDKRGEGATLDNLGLAYADLGEPHRAIEYHEQALVIDREIGNRRGEGNAICNLGNAYADLGEPHRAIAFYEQALVIDREIGDRRGEGNALVGLGLAYWNLGKPHRAIAFYEQALAIHREIGDKQGEAKACWYMSVLLKKQGQFQRATELMQVRVDYLRAIGHADADKDAKQLEEVRKKAKGENDG